jgi:hypothetical protein
MIARGSTRLFERASHLCANLGCIFCTGPQLGLKVFGLNAEGLRKILGAQKPLSEVSVGCNLPLDVFLERAYLLLIGTWKGSHGLLEHNKVALRSASYPFEIFMHHCSDRFEWVILVFHGTLPVSHAVYLQQREVADVDRGPSFPCVTQKCTTGESFSEGCVGSAQSEKLTSEFRKPVGGGSSLVASA